MPRATVTAPSRSEPGLVHIVAGYVDAGGTFTPESCSDCKGWFWRHKCWHTEYAASGQLGEPQVEAEDLPAETAPEEDSLGSFVSTATQVDFGAGIRGRLGGKRGRK